MLTKSDLKAIERLTKRLIKPLQEDLKITKADAAATKLEIKAVNAHNARIETRLIDMDQRFEENLRDWKSELFDRIDKILLRVRTAEDENIILKARQEERETLNNRLSKPRV